MHMNDKNVFYTMLGKNYENIFLSDSVTNGPISFGLGMSHFRDMGLSKCVQLIHLNSLLLIAKLSRSWYVPICVVKPIWVDALSGDVPVSQN